MTPTPEQLAIVDAAITTQDNLLVKALAGAAKTTTLELIAKAINSPMLCLAFNKRIEVEMSKRLPAHCTTRTVNGLCHRAWADTRGVRCQVDPGKNYKLLKAAIDGLDRRYKDQAYKEMSETLDLISQAKTAGYIPSVFDNAKPLVREEELFEFVLDPTPNSLQEVLIKQVMVESVKQALKGVIDFDDQILMCATFSTLFPSFPLVLVDEAQDLSEINHVILRKLVQGRIIGVGDHLQSIYAFRGAHTESMGLLQKQFNMTELGLSISFRCPQNVVKEAWWRAPHMRWPEWAVEGEVSHPDSWSPDAEVDAIICRNNAPLFSNAIKFLKAGRNVKIVGSDIGKGLIKTMKKLGDFQMRQIQVHDAISKWQETQLARTKSKGTILDRADCFRIFADQGSNLGEAIAYAEHVFAQDGQVQFTTGHKAKGMEWNNVFFLDEGLIRHEHDDQEANLRYVIQTRAKQSLTYVNSETLEA